MNNEAPERIWRDVVSERIVTRNTPSPFSKTAVEYIRADLARVDPPAAPASRNCVNCNHNNVDRHGICKTQTSPPNYRSVTYCGCKCEFTVTPAAPDERDRREVLKVINTNVLASHNLNADPGNFVINQNSLCDALLGLLATVRAEGRNEGLREATIIARTMAAGETYETGRQKALNIAAALESARTGKAANETD